MLVPVGGVRDSHLSILHVVDPADQRSDTARSIWWHQVLPLPRHFTSLWPSGRPGSLINTLGVISAEVYVIFLTLQCIDFNCQINAASCSLCWNCEGLVRRYQSNAGGAKDTDGNEFIPHLTPTCLELSGCQRDRWCCCDSKCNGNTAHIYTYHHICSNVYQKLYSEYMIKLLIW